MNEMSEEKKEEKVEEQAEEQVEEQQEQNCECGQHYGHYGHWRGHWIRRRMMMNFASMTMEEEIELLESVKKRLEERLAVVNSRLTKLKA